VWGEPDNQIEMTIATEVSALDYGDAVTISGSTIPAVTSRKAQTDVTVADHETLVIGGLTTETEQKNMTKVPFLGDIPVLGSLFRYNNNSKQRTTVVLVMTPRILP
jgi:pilus assembly protein CpaC